MQGVNKVILLGFCGQDPTIRYSSSGDAVANISLATSEQWKDKQSGEKREKTEWHRLVAFKRTAEVIAEYVKKGTCLYIEGKLQTRKWQDKEGIDRYTTEVVVFNMQMVGGRNGGGSQAKTDAQAESAGSGEAPKDDVQTDDFDDDIPF